MYKALALITRSLLIQLCIYSMQLFIRKQTKVFGGKRQYFIYEIFLNKRQRLVCECYTPYRDRKRCLTSQCIIFHVSRLKIIHQKHLLLLLGGRCCSPQSLESFVLIGMISLVVQVFSQPNGHQVPRKYYFCMGEVMHSSYAIQRKHSRNISFQVPKKLTHFRFGKLCKCANSSQPYQFRTKLHFV